MGSKGFLSPQRQQGRIRPLLALRARESVRWSMHFSPKSSPPLLAPGPVIRRVAFLAAIAVLLLYASEIFFPSLAVDDFQILAKSWTWPRVWANFWLPQNEHAMPLGRVLTCALAYVVPLPLLPAAAALVGPIFLLLGMALVYVFVRRELGHPFYALLAVVLFGVTAVYQQAVYWFASCFSVLSLDTILLGLLAAQSWRQTGRVLYLDLTVLFCALAPGWFAVGILGGPLCFLYLLVGDRRAGGVNPPVRANTGGITAPARRFSHLTFLPILGSLLFLAVSLPRTAETILHLPHYEGKSALEAFHPTIGVQYTGRSLVDNLLLGQIGITGVSLPIPLVVVILVLLVAVGSWWWWQAPDRRLLLLGLGLIASNYLLVYSARAEWRYDGVMTEPSWSRYHLLPQLGLVLFVVGGLPGQRLALAEDGRLTRRQARFLYGLILLLLVVNLPRGIVGRWHYYPEQTTVLHRIEEMDARCREYHVSAETARAALGDLEIPGCGGRENGWDFLRGSDDPRPISVEEARRLLAEEDH
jgi:hypothetical protein